MLRSGKHGSRITNQHQPPALARPKTFTLWYVYLRRACALGRSQTTFPLCFSLINSKYIPGNAGWRLTGSTVYSHRHKTCTITDGRRKMKCAPHPANKSARIHVSAPRFQLHVFFPSPGSLTRLRHPPQTLSIATKV